MLCRNLLDVLGNEARISLLGRLRPDAGAEPEGWLGVAHATPEIRLATPGATPKSYSTIGH